MGVSLFSVICRNDGTKTSANICFVLKIFLSMHVDNHNNQIIMGHKIEKTFLINNDAYPSVLG